MSPERPATWGTCRVCGDAVPPGGAACPTCGSERPIPGDRLQSLPSRQRLRLRLHGSLRAVLVVVVVAGLAYAILSAVVTGPPHYSDPLTGRWTYTIAPGNSSVLGGAITGEDYIEGNFTVVTPPGALAALAIYNQSGFEAWQGHGAAATVATPYSSSDGRIVFAAPYTDTFYFVFSNPYPAGSGVVITVLVSTNYESNVVLG
ncbi:MAG TPA: hypothetical protein VJS68_03610 [Thermoplasmata archaeon]|nr:hypothetical protein [Thermoplasmata archaeon]